jgi:hypothetical protein
LNRFRLNQWVDDVTFQKVDAGIDPRSVSTTGTTAQASGIRVRRLTSCARPRNNKARKAAPKASTSTSESFQTASPAAPARHTPRLGARMGERLIWSVPLPVARRQFAYFLARSDSENRAFGNRYIRHPKDFPVDSDQLRPLGPAYVL